MSEWKDYKLSDFIEINPKVTLKSGSKYSFVEMKDLSESQKFVLPSQLKDISGGARFQNFDTLFARITPCLQNGKICQVKGLNNSIGFGSTEFLVFRGKEGISNTDFVYYLSRYEVVRKFAEQNMIGTSGRQRVSKDAFENIELFLPDLSTQTAIAEILSSLDDKIELNNKINQELETLAQTLFKQWFIDFEFPNENGEPYKSSGGEMVESELGEIPKGWEVKPIAEFFEMVVGGDWGKDIVDDEYTELNYVIRGTDIPTLTNGTINSIPYRAIKPSKLKNRQLQINDIIIEISGGSKDQPTGRTILITKEILERLNNNAIPASFCRLIRPKKDFAELLGIYLKKIYDEGKTWEYQNQSTGISNFQFMHFQSTELLILPADMRIIDDFNSMISGFYNLRTTNESQELILLRDTLLPKLISGELEINEISNQ
jgi:type I restriction enzyme S subunit